MLGSFLECTIQLIHRKNITIPRSSSCPLRIALVNVVVNLEVRQAQAKTRMARLGNSSNLHRNYHKKRTAERFTLTGQYTMGTLNEPPGDDSQKS